MLIRTSDGEGIIVKGTLGEVRQKLLAQGEALVSSMQIAAKRASL